MLDKGSDFDAPKNSSNAEDNDLGVLDQFRRWGEFSKSSLRYKHKDGQETLVFQDTRIDINANKSLTYTAKDGSTSQVLFSDGKFTKVTEPDGTTWDRKKDGFWLKNGKELHEAAIKVGMLDLTINEANGLSHYISLINGSKNTKAHYFDISQFTDVLKNEFSSIDKNKDTFISQTEILDYGSQPNLSSDKYLMACALKNNFHELRTMSERYNENLSCDDVLDFEKRLKDYYSSSQTDLYPATECLYKALTLSIKLAKKDFEVTEGSLTPNATEQARLDLKTQLSKQFGVEFPEQSDSNLLEPISGTSVGDGRLQREPSLHELMALKNALERSAPSQLKGRSGKGIGFCFLQQDVVKNADAFQHEDKEGNAYVSFQPRFSNHLSLASQQKAAKQPLQESQEHAILHELGHNGQHRRGIHFVPSESSIQDVEIAKKLGWVKGQRASESAWFIQAKSGKLYENLDRSSDLSSVPEATFLFRKWDNLKQFHNTIPNTQKSTAIYESKQVRNLLKVKPSTEYFPTPWEMEAEGEALFKQGKEGREQLLLTDQALYQEVKEEDQQQIGSHLIRNVDGYIVPDTEENREAIRTFEARVIQKPKH